MVISSQDPRDALDWGTSVPGADVIEVYFAPDGELVRDGWGEVFTSEGFNDYELERFDRAFRLIEASVNIQFEVVSNRAEASFVIGLDADGEMGALTLGWMMPPGETNAGNAMFNGLNWDRTAGGDLTVGGYGFVTIVHELLHGLGLAHPFDDGGTSEVFYGVSDAYDVGPALLNQGVFTTMSYASGFIEGPVGTSAADLGFWTHGYEIGPSPLDIATLQQKYGANLTARTGDTTYTLPDQNKLGVGYRTIWDTDGNDTIAYFGDRDATIDLHAATLLYDFGGGGYISGADGVAGGFTIAAGVVIENAHSGEGDDRLIGNSAGNWLVAGLGNDVLLGRFGADTLLAGRGNDKIDGGPGRDLAKGYGGADTIYGDLGRDRLFGGRGDDDLRAEDGNDIARGEAGDDRLHGGAGDDVLLGGAGDDRMSGGAGADRLRAGLGRDTLDGGVGADTFLFSDHTGRDRILDFDATEDHLSFDPALWGGEDLTASEIADMVLKIDTGLIWRFGDGDSVLLVGLSNTAELEDAILVWA